MHRSTLKQRFSAGNGKILKATLVEPAAGKKKLTAWCWRVMSQFTPSLKSKNVSFLEKVKKGVAHKIIVNRRKITA